MVMIMGAAFTGTSSSARR